MEKGMPGWKSLGFKSYKEYLNSEMWINKKLHLFNTRPKKCEKCSTKENLQVHHTNYLNVGNEGKNDLLILCKKCHKEEHNGL